MKDYNQGKIMGKPRLLIRVSEKGIPLNLLLRKK